MTERVARSRSTGGGSYFSRPKEHLSFFSTGCKTLDLALGGGWVENQPLNIVGNKAVGKTLLCIEAAANFAAKYNNGEIYYREGESAFDESYAGAIGFPTSMVNFGEKPLDTVEDMFEELDELCPQDERKAASRPPTFYICDSLDSLTDRQENKRDIDQGTFGGNKAKKMSELFRRLKRRMESSKLTLMVVSQIRDNVGVVIGRKWTRTGGRALDFYAHQILHLDQMAVLTREISSIKRATGVTIKARVDKNKVSLAHREVDFNIRYAYGIDDLTACLTFLGQVGKLSDVGLSSKEEATKLVNKIMADANGNYDEKINKIHEATERHWYAVEEKFLPARKKYQTG